MKKYTSIEQFRNAIQQIRKQHDFQGLGEDESPIYLHKTPYPTITFKGTVKLHGTNSGIVLYPDNTIKYQSRERELSLDDDNAGFMNAMQNKDLSFLFKDIAFNDYIAVYGEWCGGSIQKHVALNKLPKMLVIFGCMVDDKWIDYSCHDNNQGIYNIGQFQTYSVEVDFEKPELAQNKFVRLTQEVEGLSSR